MASRLETVFTCDLCGHRWLPRTLVKSKRCASCKSTQWDSRGRVPLGQQARVPLGQRRARQSPSNPPPISGVSAHHSLPKPTASSVSSVLGPAYRAEPHHQRCSCAKCKPRKD